MILDFVMRFTPQKDWADPMLKHVKYNNINKSMIFNFSDYLMSS